MSDQIICSNCRSEMDEAEKYCNNCGYPEHGDEKEQSRFMYSIKLKQDALAEAKKKLSNVRVMLYILAAINVMVGLYWLASEGGFADGIANIITAAVFIGCAILVKKQPLIGVLSAFIFWLVMQLSVVFIDPALLINGVVLKVVVIVLFVKGIQSARDAKEFTDKLKANKNA